VVAEVNSIIESHEEGVGIPARRGDDVSLSLDSNERKNMQVTVFQ
jgi:hypothetical protein